MKLKHIYHLYSRTGFGISNQDAQKLQSKSTDEIVDALLHMDGKQGYLTCVQQNEMPSRMKVKGMSKEEKKDLREKSRTKIKMLNTTWVKQMVTSPAPLIEKTTLFWHGHFACHLENPYTIQQLHNIQRKYAFAPFKDMLLAVSKSPAMLQFLNNNQNRKQHPNENFARELMELFTIGRDNYTEQDIKESARALTGWGFDPDTYEFVFRERAHDDGLKTFMGQTGNFNGEDIINIILNQKQTAVYLCRKFYHFFVNDVVDESNVIQLADFYYKNNYDTGKLLQKLFTSDWFYSDANIGSNIKSPVEFIVGFSKTFGVIPPDEALLKLQKALGQILFYPPNVAGWPGGRNWIDSSTLLLRLKTPSLVLNGGKIDIADKGDMPEETFNVPETIILKPDEKPFYTSVKADDLIESLLLPKLNDSKKSILLSDNPTNKQLVLKIVSMPEYQLC